jgi:hypothetical protein
MNYTLKLVPNWEENLREKHKVRLRDSGDWKRSEAGSSLVKRIKEIYRLSGDAEFVNEIKLPKNERE